MQLVYVNYGTTDDFALLSTMNISVVGRIVLTRYGAIYRGDKVANAAQAGAIGCLIYSDPASFAPVGTAPNQVYPFTQWLPSQGVQRGSIFEGGSMHNCLIPISITHHGRFWGPPHTRLASRTTRYCRRTHCSQRLASSAAENCDSAYLVRGRAAAAAGSQRHSRASKLAGWTADYLPHWARSHHDGAGSAVKQQHRNYHQRVCNCPRRGGARPCCVARQPQRCLGIW